MRMPTEPTELAYIAGLFDGEGCLTRTTSGGRVVQIGMTDRDVIEYLAGIGGTMRAETNKPPRRVLYRWRLLAQVEVQEFLNAICPYLRVKRDLAMVFLDELLALEYDPGLATTPLEDR